MKIDIHNYAHRVNLALKRIDKADISQKNKDYIKQFMDFCIADGMSAGRVVKYANTIKYWALWLDKDFDIVTKQDIAPVVTKIQLNDRYTAWTKKDYKILFKRFFKWVKGTEEYPEEVKWIHGRMKLNETRLPAEGELLNENDIKRLLDVADHPRDKALISMLWESGCRVGELCSMLISNVEIDKYGLLISVHGKTGSRKLRLISSTQHLMTWLKMHPLRKDKSSPLWINFGSKNQNEIVSYPRVNNMLKKHFKKAGIDKKSNPHIFRHSRATYLANHLTEFQMNQYFGWKQGSDMPSTYVHLSGKEIEGAILALNGVVDKEKKKEITQLRPKKCPRCESINSYDSKYCSKCAGILDIKEAMILQDQHEETNKRLNETEAFFKRLREQPHILKGLMQMMGGVGDI